MLDAHHFERRFDRLELFMTLMIRGFHHMSTALARLIASTSALTDQVSANDTELAAVAQAVRDLKASNVTDEQLNALADQIDASRGNLKTAADAAADALEAHGPDTTAGAGGDTSVSGGAGDDSLSIGAGGDAVQDA